jgi:peptidoglycan/xylan/chitin deacetylase (PgdA/CDA1 family)
MRWNGALIIACAVVVSCNAALSEAALAGNCTNPNALGTARTLTVDPVAEPRVGTMQYPSTLPLNDHEVVLTFDDGPLPRYSNAILDILAAQCVQATYFLVGDMAKAFPATVRRIAAEGHTIGTHSESHPFTFRTMPMDRAQNEINDGIAAVTTALGDAGAVAPFFRIPGLLRREAVEDYLADRKISTFSADVPSDDWRHIKAGEIVKRTMSRLEAKGRGIILMHDIHAVTVAALPMLLDQLKSHGYRVVHLKPMPPQQPAPQEVPLIAQLPDLQPLPETHGPVAAVHTAAPASAD